MQQCAYLIADDRLLTTAVEPLNLISRPLDLTKCRGLDCEPDDDDDPDSVYGMLIQSVTTDNLACSCVCGKTFDAVDTFSAHVSSCAKSKLTPYRACETCGKTFFSHSGFMKHRRLHAGQYKYFCSVCRRGFFDQVGLVSQLCNLHSFHFLYFNFLVYIKQFDLTVTF